MSSRLGRTWWFAAAIAAVLLVASMASADPWPSSLSYSAGVSTDEDARIQLSASVQGLFAPQWGAKVGGWWVTGGDDNRAFVGDAYINYSGQSFYAAGGRKFVPFGPAGVLVSPGLAGFEAQYHQDRLTLQGIAGTLAFTPVTGGTRFTFGGSRAPADESIRAARLAVELTDPLADNHTIVGGNWLDLEDDSGLSVDFSADLDSRFTLFGETADFDHENAYVVGLRYTNQKLCPDPTKYTMVTLYQRDIPVGYVPAAVGATNYFEDQQGLAVGVYHQFNANHGVGVFADSDDAIVTLFGYLPLR
jgi:hypothetical protein